jgi:hypothetical protein
VKTYIQLTYRELAWMVAKLGKLKYYVLPDIHDVALFLVGKLPENTLIDDRGNLFDEHLLLQDSLN